MAYKKALPNPTGLSQPFWDGTRQNKLMLQKCNDCGDFRFTPQMLCRNCYSDNFTWTEVSGRATLWSYTTIYRPQTPEFSEDVPYIEIVAELEEGPLMLSDLEGIEPESCEIGMPLKVHFEKATDEITLPKFEPA